MILKPAGFYQTTRYPAIGKLEYHLQFQGKSERPATQPAKSRFSWLKALPFLLGLLVHSPISPNGAIHPMIKASAVEAVSPGDSLVIQNKPAFSPALSKALQEQVLQYASRETKISSNDLKPVLLELLIVAAQEKTPPDLLLPLSVLVEPSFWRDETGTGLDAAKIWQTARQLSEAHSKGVMADEAYLAVLSGLPNAGPKKEIAKRIQKIGPLYGYLNALREADSSPLPSSVMQGYKPKIKNVKITPSKYEDRQTDHKAIFVLHETVSSAKRVLNSVNSKSYDPSFHALILRDGTIIMMVPPNKAAYTAGLSRFKENPFDIRREKRISPKDPASESDLNQSGRHTVNYMGFQVEIVSPDDGRGEEPTHSGYTDAQYQAAAWLYVQTGIPLERVTTHKQVDQRERNIKVDPRSFEWDKFWACAFGIEDRTPTLKLGIPVK